MRRPTSKPPVMAALAGLLAALLLASPLVAAAEAPQTSVALLCGKAASLLGACSPDLAPDAQQTACCEAMGVMQGLGCFCDPATRTAARATVTPATLQAVAACQPSQNADVDSRCGDTFPGAVHVSGMPDILSVPGLGFVKGAELARHLDTLLASVAPAESIPQQQATAAFPEEERVLDLSAPAEEDSASEYDVLQISADPEVRVLSSSVTRAGDDVFMSLDLDVPEHVLAEGLDLDLDIDSDEGKSLELVSLSVDVELPEADSDAADETLTIDLEADVEGSVEVQLVSDSADSLSLDIEGDDLEVTSIATLVEDSSASETAGADVVVQLDVDLPADLMARAGVTDVSIEMEVGLDGRATLSETNITVESEAGGPPMTGRGLGALLKEAAQYLLSVIPAASPAAQPELVLAAAGAGEEIEVGSILGSAVQMLSDVGDQILRTIPDTSLGSGKTVEILIEETPLPAALGTARVSSAATDAAPLLSARRALDSLADAVRSAMYASQAEHEAQQQAACRVCEVVRRHERLLWGIVYTNVALLALCACAFAFQACRRSAAPTEPEGDLSQPLIVHAADYATPEELSSKAALSPAWAPAGKLGAAF